MTDPLNAPEEPQVSHDSGRGDLRPTERESIISVSRVGFTYPSGLRAIGNVSFSVAHGEIVSIVGPSGCGKSTLLRLLANLATPTDGTIDRQLGHRGESHGCSMVFQDDTLLPWFRVKDNVALYYKLNHERGSEVDTHVDRLLEMVGLEEYRDYYPSQLSGGMKRRVQMLSAVAPLPDLLLLDEPFSALDEPTRIAVHEDLYGLIRELNISAILVTHDLAEALTLSDRVLVLSQAPTQVVDEVAVPFAVERDVTELRSESEFLDLYGHLWSELQHQIESEEDGE